MEEETAMDESSIKQEVREVYAREARKVRNEKESGCCGPSVGSYEAITSNLYERGETAELPTEALAASLGCGNPTALAELKQGVWFGRWNRRASFGASGRTNRQGL